MRVIVTTKSEQIFLERAVWAVDLAGYAIVAGRVDGEEDPRLALRGLVVPKDQAWRPERRIYEPLLDYRGLFREFAAIHVGPPFDRYEEEIIRFANSYGALGLEQALVTTESGEKFRGEFQADWSKEIKAMRHCLDLWDAYSTVDDELLRAMIRFEPSRITYDPPDSDDSYTIASPNWQPDLWDFIKPGDHFDAAICYVQQVINRRLTERVSPRLLWNNNRVLGLHQVASSLIGAIWLQLALAVDGRKSFRRCKSCGTWIEISKGSARTTREFCSDACRSRNYRTRRSRAVQLHLQGLNAQEIANSLHTSSDVVIGWIDLAKEAQR